MTKTAFFPRLLAITVTTGALGAVFGLSGTASAATTQSFQISPPTSNFAADKGTNVKGVIKVTNLTDAPIALKVGKENFAAKGEEGEVELVDAADPLYSLAPWFNLSVTAVDLPARATKEVPYTIAVPANAEPGGRYGSIVFSSIPPKLPSGVSGASVQQTLAALVFLRINGAAREQLAVASFVADKSFAEYGPVSLTTRLKNTGTVHEKAIGTITIYNMFGVKVDTIKLDEHFVIPGAIRKLHNTWAPKGYNKFLFGTYRAELAAHYGDGKTLNGTTSFTVIPWKMLAGAIIVLVFVFVVFWRGRKRLAKAVRILAGKE
jgi:hypothetical protein